MSNNRGRPKGGKNYVLVSLKQINRKFKEEAEIPLPIVFARNNGFVESLKKPESKEDIELAVEVLEKF